MCINVYVNLLRTKLYLSNLKTQFVPRRKHSDSVIKTDKLLLYREKIRCLFWDPRKTHKCTVGRTQFLNVKACGT